MSQFDTRDAKQKFPWRSVFRLAMTQGLPPEQAWRMTPGEILACLPRGLSGKTDDMASNRLTALMARYPDVETPAVQKPPAMQKAPAMQKES